jgi:hypothetical protein
MQPLYEQIWLTENQTNSMLNFITKSVSINSADLKSNTNFSFHATISFTKLCILPSEIVLKKNVPNA